MDSTRINAAIAEAKRFLERAEVYINNVETVRWSTGEHAGEYETVSPKYSGALRRASLDLTRSLADLRKPT